MFVGIIAINFSGFTTLNASEVAVEDRLANKSFEELKAEGETFSISRDWISTPGTSYTKGEYVSDGETVKEVVQDFTTNGDLSWWDADSLFKFVYKSEFTFEPVESPSQSYLQAGEIVTQEYINGEVELENVEYRINEVEQQILSNPESKMNLTGFNWFSICLSGGYGGSIECIASGNSHDRAKRFAKYYYSEASINGTGNGDAALHTYWVAHMYRDNGKNFADKMSRNFQKAQSAPQVEKDMDARNNQVGLNMYITNKSDFALEEDVMGAISLGRMWRVNPQFRVLTPTDSLERIR
jgi:hypothetical protein